MPTLTANGCQLYYEVHGEGEPLVLIMGLRRNIEWWYRQKDALSKCFKVIMFDNRGAGRSEKPQTTYSIGLFAEDTAHLMDVLEVIDAHILGISMGGYIAQEFSINFPDKVRSLILGCTGCGGSKAVPMSQDRMEKFIANKGLEPNEILKKDMDIYFSNEFVTQYLKKIEEFTDISSRYYQPPDAFKRQFNACLNHDTANRLNRISAPTLIMAGDDDPLIPPENSKILQRLIPGADISIFPGKRHCFFIEASDRFNQEAIRFFQANN